MSPAGVFSIHTGCGQNSAATAFGKGLYPMIMPLVLASQSSRRRELLALLEIPFEAVAANIDETPYPGEAPESYARRLSREKAQAAASDISRNVIIVACDTTVADGDTILGKPLDAADAAAILRRLRGKTHTVITAVTLLNAATGQAVTQAAISPVTMRDYSDAEIDAYIQTGDPFDKAGAYAIQHMGFHPATGFAHCYANVMGLPLCHIARMLRGFGVEPLNAVPASCQQHILYDCLVFESIMSNIE